MRFDELNDMQLDAIREAGSIGGGHAATALSQLVDHLIDIEVPHLEIVPIGEVPDIFGGTETLVMAVYSRLLGDLSGSMLFLATRASSIVLVDLLRSRPVGTTKSLGHEEEALLTHAVSILVSAYLAAIARLADVSLLPSKPAFSFDMAGAILEVVTSEVGMSSDAAMLLRTRFFDAETAVDAFLLFMPDPASLDLLLGRLGMA